jgi:hypothetical protein
MIRCGWTFSPSTHRSRSTPLSVAETNYTVMGMSEDSIPHLIAISSFTPSFCSITREPELQEWVTMRDNVKKKVYELTDEIRFAIDRFYFNHYCASFRSGAFARANCSIPMMNMLGV